MSDKWTPGPWWVMPKYADRDVYVRSEHGIIAEGKYPFHYPGQDQRFEEEKERHQANARLISAAPDMAEVLAELLKDVDKLGKLGSRGHGDEEVWIGDASGVVRVGILRRARAALVKARGET